MEVGSRRLLPYVAAGVIGVLLVGGLAFVRSDAANRAGGTRELASFKESVEETESPRPAPVRVPPAAPRDQAPRPSAPAEADGATREILAPPSASKTPAAPGAELERLSEPPERSVWALAPEKYAEGLSASIEFKPYGIGPDSLGPSVVGAVLVSQPLDSTGDFPELAGKNAVLILNDQDVMVGGTYAATVTTRIRGDRIVLVLDAVRPL